MTETLLSASDILLFGRIVKDLAVVSPDLDLPTDYETRVATDRPYEVLEDHIEVDGVVVAQADKVLVKNQKPRTANGIYTVGAAGAAWSRDGGQPNVGRRVRVIEGEDNKGLWIRSDVGDDTKFAFNPAKHGGKEKLGKNDQLEAQLVNASFARIYGFSYHGTYFELAEPTIFLVHGRGENATGQIPDAHTARGPLDPSRTGIAAADFQFAHALRVWSYDKANYTIRIDIESGMFEDVLLAPFFAGDGNGVSGAKISGAKISGAKVSGAKLSGARVSGAKVSGAKLWGGRGDASD